MNPQTDESTLERVRLEAMYELFRIIAMEDQKQYYQSRLEHNRKAALGTSFYGALFAFLAGLASALAGLSVSGDVTTADIARCSFGANAQIEVVEIDADNNDNTVAVPETKECGSLNFLIPILIVAVAAPVIGGAFTTLNDLYQWDRLVSVYNNALESLEVADAQSPVDGIKQTAEYQAALAAYVEGTLDVMRDEQTQWGQLIKTPEELEAYYEQALKNYQNTLVTPGTKPKADSDDDSSNEAG